MFFSTILLVTIAIILVQFIFITDKVILLILLIVEIIGLWLFAYRTKGLYTINGFGLHNFYLTKVENGVITKNGKRITLDFLTGEITTIYIVILGIPILPVKSVIIKGYDFSHSDEYEYSMIKYPNGNFYLPHVLKTALLQLIGLSIILFGAIYYNSEKSP